MTDDDLKRLLEASAAETRRHADEAAERLAAENRHHLETAERRLNENAERLATENRQYIQTAEQRLNENGERLAIENRRYFDVAMEGNKHEIRLLAERVTLLDEKLERTNADHEERMQSGFAETQAMIRFSHAELDHRIRSLEQTQRTLEDTQRTLEEVLADLQSRVERLEGSTH